MVSDQPKSWSRCHGHWRWSWSKVGVMVTGPRVFLRGHLWHMGWKLQKFWRNSSFPFPVTGENVLLAEYCIVTGRHAQCTLLNWIVLFRNIDPMWRNVTLAERHFWLLMTCTWWICSFLFSIWDTNLWSCTLYSGKFHSQIQKSKSNGQWCLRRLIHGYSIRTS